jgi:ABC-type ATPase with predicted acetyltransferase domain
MTDNFNLIRNFLEFTSTDDFYFVQILKRRKDNPGLNTDVAVVKEYFIDSLEYFDKKREDMIEVAIKNNARVTIRLNKRSYKKTALKMLVDVASKVEQEQYKSVKASFSSCAGKYSADKNKTWLIDVDSDDLAKYNMDEVINDINASMPVGEKVLCEIKSKTGYHLLVKPFDLRVYSQKYPTLEIKKDNPTNLFIP